MLVETANDQRFYIYDGEGDIGDVVSAVVSTPGRHVLTEAVFYQEDGDDDGRRWFGRRRAWIPVWVWSDNAIILLDDETVSKGEYVDTNHFVTRHDGRVFPLDARVNLDQLNATLTELLITPGLPAAIEWQTPWGRLATHLPYAPLVTPLA